MATGALVLGLLATPAAQADGLPSGAVGGAAPHDVALRADVSAAAPEVTKSLTQRHGCASARRALAYYRSRYVSWLERRGVVFEFQPRKLNSCPWVRTLAKRWQRKAHAARGAYERWWEYQWHWQAWLPDKWARIGACETGYGRRPGNWRHSNSSYEGAFGFAKQSWDSFKYRADPKAGPYPEDAWQATPRQQYEVALAIWRRYGFSGWGCRGA